MNEAEWTPAEIAEIYDHSTLTADLFNDGQEHLGYWYDDDDEASVGEAAARLTRKIADTLGLRPGEHVLDAGCGAGVAAVQIAGEYGARVTGVTISPVGRDMARARAEAAGRSEQARFELGDYHALDFPEAHFDAVIEIEALMHAVDLDKALLELYRVLRPGGRITIAETTKVRPDAEVAMPFSREPVMGRQWVDNLTNAGFVPEEWIECGHRVFGHSGTRFPRHFETIREDFVARFGEELFDNIREGQGKWFALGTEYMGYTILSARKPA